MIALSSVNSLFKATRMLSMEHCYYLFSSSKLLEAIPSIAESREHVQKSLDSLRGDHLRTLNPTPYKVSLSLRIDACRYIPSLISGWGEKGLRAG